MDERTFEVEIDKENNSIKKNLTKTQIISEIQKNEKLKEVDHEAPICWAVRNNYEDALKMLIESGEDVTANRNYAIVLASCKGYNNIVKILYEAGADIKCRRNLPLQIAAEYNKIDTVILLANLIKNS